ncbi:TetR/AcrR family transcriptional regulator [Nocardia jinanensis]|uniref:Transcriptional regulator, TetR family protein n=1 Tax=Nocardia jinanensis TaxID=382504 RepID=A0A917RB50_9NOCA|nr:TetR/AcrR family transcriptional regulator [Nocardia jinanensis]GGK99329.1 putative transcriptional regulator, TetR family protein [Nocardia jinanensis]
MSAPPSTSQDRSTADGIEARILDAARTQFELFGVKKTTIGDVARQADVDRGTIYRRIGSRDDLVRAVSAREVGALLAELEGIPSRHESVEAIVAEIFVTVITRWRTHGLINRVLALEPGRLLPQVTTEGGAFFTAAVATTATLLSEATRQRGLPEIPDLTTRVEIAGRVVHSLILQPVGTLNLESEERLTEFARGYIVPLIVG